jgi:hypothetical protein
MKSEFDLNNFQEHYTHNDIILTFNSTVVKIDFLRHRQMIRVTIVCIDLNNDGMNKTSC